MTPNVGRACTSQRFSPLNRNKLKGAHPKVIGILVCPLQLLGSGSHSQVVEHDIPLCIRKLVGLDRSRLGSFDLGSVFCVFVLRFVATTSTAATASVVEVFNKLLE